MKLDSPEWLEAARILHDFTPTGDTGKDGFAVARILHGVLGRHNINPHAVRPMSIGKRVMRLLRDNCPSATDGIPEVVVVSWGNVLVPDGWHPIAWAVKRVRWSGRRPRLIGGDYVTKAQHELASLLYHTLSFLPVVKGEVFASVRSLATHTGHQKDVIAATLTLMHQQGIITRVYKGKGLRASRYKLPCLQTDALDATDAVGSRTLSRVAKQDLDALFTPPAPPPSQQG